MSNLNKITHEEIIKIGYLDVTGNCPIDNLVDEIEFESELRNPSEIIIRYEPLTRKATVYIPQKDFYKGVKK